MSRSSVMVSFKVRAGRDDDIIKWLESLPEGERSVCIRMTLREHLKKPGKKEGPRGLSSAGSCHSGGKKADGQPGENDRGLLDQRLDGFDF